MGASDYAVGNAPQGASYAAPLAGFAFGQAIGNLPEDYMKGREMKRTRQMQDAFKDGIPTNPDGSPNVNAIIDKGVKIGGLPFAQSMIPFLQSGQFLDQANRTPPPTIGGGESPNAAGPAAVGARPQQPTQAQPSAGGEDGPTINYVVQNSGRQLSPQQIFSLARVVGINPNAPLNPDQVAKVQSALKDLPTPGRVASSEDIVPSGQPSSAAERGSNGPNGEGGTPTPAAGVDGSPGGTPAPFMAPGRSQQAAAGGGNGAAAIPPNAAPTQGTVASRWPQYAPEAAANGLPANWNEKTAGNFDKYARSQGDLAAASATTNPAMSKVFQERSTQAAATAKMIREKIAEQAGFTGAQKEARDPAVTANEGQKLAQKQEITRGDALQKGLQGAAREFETALKPHLDAMRGILNDPNFVSGTGVGFQEALNKIRSNPLFQGLPGYDPNAALPNEAIRKVVAASILNQTTELKAEAAEMGGSAGRLFQQQISLMEKAAQNPENTAPALRYLTELQQRMGDHSRAVAELANRYEGKYGRGVLDNGFNDVLSKFNNDPKHQIFTPSEIKDMRLFAPPAAPALHDKAEALAWADKSGIRPGDPIKTPTGRIVAFDPGKFK